MIKKLSVTCSLFLLATLVAMPAWSASNSASVSTALASKDVDLAKGESAPLKPGQVAAPEIAVPSPDLITGATYAFTSAAAVALEDMSSGTTTLVGANLDDTASAVTNIGFDFFYDAVRFTQFSVNANGLVRLGGAAVSGAFDNGTGFATATNAPKIAPYFDDLYTGTNGKVHFKVTGTIPNRKLIVEWQNEQIPLVGAGNAGAGTFQMWLFESVGVIEFVYGSGMAVNSANAGYTIGLQSGAATNFASVTTAGTTVSYAAANNTQTDAIAAGTAYIFTPNTPTAATGYSATAVTATSMTLNWTDSPDEVGYAIYSSLDGINLNFVTLLPANTITYTAMGLTPSTTYFWAIAAYSEGRLNPLGGMTMTSAPGNIASTGAGGLWSAPGTWTGGMVPTASDNVTIVDGATVTIDPLLATPAVAFSLAVGSGGAAANLIFQAASAAGLTVGGSVTIASNGTIASAASGTVTTHVLSVGGSLTNNGVLDFSTNADTAGAILTFTGAANNTFGGTGTTTDIRAITMNKGTSSANILDVSPTNFTVQGVTTDVAGYLTLTNGTFKISGTFTMTNRTFPGPTYIIPLTGGIWLNNPNYVVAPTISAAATSNNGLLRVSQGNYNIGIGAGDQMRGGAGAAFTLEGTGIINVSGAFDPQNNVTYTQTGGTMNV
ncbi:MAG: fibronectin type III domain-containing protein, partial [Dokdonella sp.]